MKPALWLWSREVPRPLTGLSTTPTETSLFMFSAVTWNRHHVHFNAQAARSEGLPGVVVHRALLGNFLSRMLTDWLEDRGEIRALSWKVLKSAVPGRPLRCEGEIVRRSEREGRRFLFCELRVLDPDSETVASGSAEVELFE
jgi:hydroxyacyl-ACP dehydratase HTD2-like protein with hotdog domain